MNNKPWAVPLPSSNEILTNKKISIKTYYILMLYSNWGGSMFNNDTRYVYDNKISENIEDILSTLNITNSSFRTHLSNLRKHSKSIFKATMVKDELVYMLIPKDNNNKNYVLINSDILLKLINHCNENCIRIYILLCYICRNGPKQITHQWLSESIGNSSNSIRLISKAVNELESNNFIYVERLKTVHKTYDELSNKIISNPKDIHVYSIIT